MEKTVSTITDIMSVISNALLLPVLICVLVCFAWVLLSFGGFLREWVGRSKRRKQLAKLARDCEDETITQAELWNRFVASPHDLVKRLVGTQSTLTAASPVFRKRLNDLESDIADSLSRLTFLTRIGPMLGLLGTIIPLGPALMGLSAGNMQQLSSNLVVAFTATVVGLVTSCVAYGIGLVRRGWYGRDIDDLEFLVSRLNPEGPSDASEAKMGS